MDRELCGAVAGDLSDQMAGIYREVMAAFVARYGRSYAGVIDADNLIAILADVRP